MEQRIHDLENAQASLESKVNSLQSLLLSIFCGLHFDLIFSCCTAVCVVCVCRLQFLSGARS